MSTGLLQKDDGRSGGSLIADKGGGQERRSFSNCHGSNCAIKFSKDSGSVIYLGLHIYWAIYLDRNNRSKLLTELLFTKLAQSGCSLAPVFNATAPEYCVFSTFANIVFASRAQTKSIRTYQIGA